MQQPWQLNQALKPERIKQLSSLIRSVRDEVVDLHDHDLGDSARSTGLRAYECCRNHIIRASIDSELWPWLGIIKSDGKFTFSIDSVPVRLYRGVPSCPEERRLIPCIEAMSQMDFLFEDVGTSAAVVWFFAIEVDESKYVERVTFTGYLDGTQVSCWEVPLEEKTPVHAIVDKALPEPIKIEKAIVSIKKKEEKMVNKS